MSGSTKIGPNLWDHYQRFFLYQDTFCSKYTHNCWCRFYKLVLCFYLSYFFASAFVIVIWVRWKWGKGSFKLKRTRKLSEVFSRTLKKTPSVTIRTLHKYSHKTTGFAYVIASQKLHWKWVLDFSILNIEIRLSSCLPRFKIGLINGLQSNKQGQNAAGFS